MTQFPFVSVIIPVWNGATQIETCLAAIEAQTYPADRCEIIVVDNGSDDDTTAVVARHRAATLLHEPVASSYRARNRGLDRASGDYALFTDADCVPEPDWIAAAVRAAHADPDAGVWGGRITLFAVEPCDRACRLYESLFSFNQMRTIAAGHCVTANWMSPISLLRDLGGFDPLLKSGGDVEMSGRIRSRGGRIVYVPDMTVGHPVRGTFADLRGKYVRTVGARWKIREGLRWRLPRLLAGQTLAFARRVVRIYGTERLSFADQTRIAVLSLRLWIEALREIGRLASGSEPRRS